MTQGNETPSGLRSDNNHGWKTFTVFARNLIRSLDFHYALSSALQVLCIPAAIESVYAFRLWHSPGGPDRIRKVFSWNLNSGLTDVTEYLDDHEEQTNRISTLMEIQLKTGKLTRLKMPLTKDLPSMPEGGLTSTYAMAPVLHEGTPVFLVAFIPFGSDDLLFGPWNEILMEVSAGIHAFCENSWMTRELERVKERDLELSRRATLNSLQEAVIHREELRRANQLLETQNVELNKAKIKAEESNRLKNQFLATTSHELRTPLNVIIGFLNMYIHGQMASPEEKEEFILTAHKSASQLMDIINTVLEISKIESGAVTVNPMEIEVKDFFAEMQSLIGSKHKDPKAGLAFTSPVPENMTVNVDLPKFSQVMLNLLDNAVKFTEQGEITVSARRNDDGSVEFEVQDTGIGIDPANLEKLFVPFAQIDGGMNRRFGGAGLGLAISKKLIELMGGLITVTSEGVGKGSVAKILLPPDPQKPLSPADLKHDIEAVRRRRFVTDGTMRIAAVGLAEDLRRLLENRLGFNFAVSSVDTMREGISAVRERGVDFDCLIVKFDEEKRDIGALIQAAREAGDIPVIICAVSEKDVQAKKEFFGNPIIVSVTIEEKILKDPSPLLRNLDSIRDRMISKPVS
jgi:signal transduction histidine kinase